MENDPRKRIENERSAVEKLARFGAACIRDWPSVGGWDGGDVQEEALKADVLIDHEGPHDECEDWEEGDPCYCLAPDVAEYLTRLEPQSATTPGAGK